MSVPKILFSYWDKSPLSFLQYLTFLSFRLLNPDWKLQLYQPKFPDRSVTWVTTEQKEPYTGYDYLPYLYNLGVEVIDIDFKDIGFRNDVPEIYKADYLRIHVLSTQGGVWSDMDIVYIKPLMLPLDTTTFGIVYDDYYSIGFMYSCQNSRVFTYLKEKILLCFNRSAYQCLGSPTYKHLLGTLEQVQKGLHEKPFNIPFNDVYPVDWEHIHVLYEDTNLNFIKPSTFAVHWYNGSKLSRKYSNNLTFSNYCNNRCNLSKIIKQLYDASITGISTHYVQLPKNYVSAGIQEMWQTFGKQPKVSIVMAYCNRRKQLLYTLNTFLKSAHKNIEVIITDDASSERIDDVPSKYPFPIKVIRIEPLDRTWKNPCIPFNIALKHVTGNITILQNPECCHIGDCITYAVKNLSEKNYISFSALALPSFDMNDKLYAGQDPLTICDPLTWYNHPVKRPCAYHFTSAVYSHHLKTVGYFSEKYKDGYCYDDDDLVLKIKQILHLNIIIPDPKVGYVVHQYHPPSLPTECAQQPDSEGYKLWLRNKQLFESSKY